MRRLALIAFCMAIPCPAQLSPQLQKSIDDVVLRTLAETGVPGASVAVAKDESVYAKAYGFAKFDPKTPATAEMRFKIASNSKQIAGAAILLLAEDRKLSLDDTVAKYLPALTRAKEITLRQLLAHTSGYQDYYPLDYVAPYMAKDTTANQILDKWAKKDLDFDPGTKWQYSNTNYVIIGQVIEKVTGTPLIDFLKKRIFQPLGMRSVIDVTRETWSAADPTGYTQHAMSPFRAVVPEGNGWMYAAGELAMTAADLAKWDASLIERSVLKPESLRALTTEALLKGGTGTRYGLGMQVGTTPKGNRRWSHSGGASGFLSRNTTFPDDGISITVLTNGEGTAFETIAQRLEELLFPPTADPSAAEALEKAIKFYSGLQNGELDRSLTTLDLESYFTREVLADFAASLKPLGVPESFTATGHSERGGMATRGFAVKAGGKTLSISTFVTPEGKFDQFLISEKPKP
jgi:D-alanyl-D-alanine carboxypeptidase